MAELTSLGLQLPTPAYLMGAIGFGLVGLAAVRYGRKRQRRKAVWLGIALMFYPF